MSKIKNTFWTDHQIKKTKQREVLLALLQNLEKPATTEELYQSACKEATSLNLSTVYRTLELFYKKNIVIKTVSSETQKAMYELNRYEHRHYMVCVKCQNIFPLENCPCDLIEQFVLENSNFKMLDHKLEILGYCPACK